MSLLIGLLTGTTILAIITPFLSYALDEGIPKLISKIRRDSDS